MATLSSEAPPSEQKSQSLIGKVSASLQLPLEVRVAIETVSVLRRAFRTAHALSDLAWKISLLSDFIGDFKYEI